MSPFKRPKPAPRGRKPYTSGLTPALLVECQRELERQMALAASGQTGGRPKRGQPGYFTARARKGPKSPAHREAIAEAMRAKWAERRRVSGG